MSIRIDILAVINERKLKSEAAKLARDVEAIGHQHGDAYARGMDQSGSRIKDALTPDARQLRADFEKLGLDMSDSMAKSFAGNGKLQSQVNKVLGVYDEIEKRQKDLERSESAREQILKRQQELAQAINIESEKRNTLLQAEIQLRDQLTKGREEEAKIAKTVETREKNITALKARQTQLQKEITERTRLAEEASLNNEKSRARELRKANIAPKKENDSITNALKIATAELAKEKAVLNEATEKGNELEAQADQLKSARIADLRAQRTAINDLAKAKNDQVKIDDEVAARTAHVDEANRKSIEVWRGLRREIEGATEAGGRHRASGGGLLGGGGGGGNGRGNQFSSFASSFPGVPSSLPPVLAGGALTGLIGAVGIVAKAVVTATQALWLLPAAAAAGGAAFGTLAIATAGFDQALKHMGDPKKFAQALAGLSPEAQQAALSIKALVDGPLGELKHATQDAFFNGMGKEIWDLSTKFKSPVQGLTTSIAASFNDMFKKLGTSLMQPENMATIQHIFDNIAATFQKLSPAAVNFTNALLKIASVGSDFLPDLVQKLADAAAHFSSFIDTAQKSGKLKEWIQSGIDAAAKLGGALINIGKKIYEIFATNNTKDFEGGLKAIVDVLTGLGKAVEFFSKMVEWLSEHEALVKTLVELWLAFKGLQLVNMFAGMAGGLRGVNGQLGAMPGLMSRLQGGLGGLGILGGSLAFVDGKRNPALPAAAAGVGGAIAGASVGGPIGALIGALGGLTAAVIKDTIERSDNKSKKDAEYNQRAPFATTPQARKRLHNEIYGDTDASDIEKIAKLSLNVPMPSPGKAGPAALSSQGAEFRKQLEQRAKDGDFAYLGINGDNFSTSLNKLIENAKLANDAIKQLGENITTLPTGEIVLKDPTPELMERVKALGLKITQLPDGQVKIDVNTDVANNQLQHFVEQWGNTVIRMQYAGVDGMPPGSPLNPSASSAVSGILSGARNAISQAPSNFPGPFNVPAVPESGGGGDSASKRKDAFFNAHPELAQQFLPPELQGLDPSSLTRQTTASFAAAPGESPREFAHRVMMPYWESMGLQVGDHAADKYGEHQNGALDVMIPNLQAGQEVLQQALMDPNVYGAIFNNATYGYGHGPVPQDYSSGHTGDPSQDHTNHVHILYKPGNKGNLGTNGPVQYAGNGRYGYQSVNQQAIIDAQQNVWKQGIDLQQARMDQAFINQDKDSSIEDKARANEKVIEQGWEYDKALTKLNEAQQGTFKKLAKGAKGFADGMDQIGAKIDEDFGISKGLPGIVENITKFLANLAFAPVFGALTGVTAANGTAGPGSGLLGAFAPRQNAFGQDMPNALGQVLPTNQGSTSYAGYGPGPALPGTSTIGSPDLVPGLAPPGSAPFVPGPGAPISATPTGPTAPGLGTLPGPTPGAAPGITPAGPGTGPIGGPGTGIMPGGPIPQSYNLGNPWQLPNTTGSWNTPSRGVPLGEGMPNSQGIGIGSGGLLGMAGSAIQSGIGAAGMAAGMGMDGGAGGAVASAVAQIGIDLAKRGISYGGQVAGIATQGLMETFLPVESQLADPTRGWFGRILGGIAGIRPVAENLAGALGGAMKGPQAGDKPGEPDAPLSPEQVDKQKAKDAASNTSNQNNNVKIDYTANGMTPDQNAETVSKLTQASYGGNR